MKNKLIIVTGSVASGKTTVAKKIAKKYKLEYVDLNSLIKKNKLYDFYDRKFKSYVVDVKKMNKFLRRYIEGKDLVIDSHLSHFLGKKYVDLCIVVKCDLKILRKRLEKRKYSKEKIKENLDAEIFDVCLEEAKEEGYKIKVVDGSRDLKSKDIENLI